jgi:uncharacterized protein
MERRAATILAVAILIGLAISSYFIGSSLERFKTEDRYITVKGFSEREVKADLAVWLLRVAVASDDLSEGSRLIESTKSKVIRFLRNNGMDSTEITQKDLQVRDKRASDYQPQNSAVGLRYIVTNTIQVRSNNVDNVLRVSRMTDELLHAGVGISSSNEWQGNGPRFMFTKLNDIKPEMLAFATRNARNAALEFTKESSTTLGKMRKASQGLFTIADRDEMPANQNGGAYYGSGTTDLFKKVRVVISVEYSIE